MTVSRGLRIATVAPEIIAAFSLEPHEMQSLVVETELPLSDGHDAQCRGCNAGAASDLRA